MATIYTHIDANIRKTWLYLSFFFILIIAVGWTISYVYGTDFPLWFAFFFALASALASYWFSDKMVIAMTGARPVTEQEVPELYHIVENLSLTSGLPMPRLYIVEEEAANAFATGRNPQNAVIAVTRGLLKKLNKVELEGVIAHELSHVGNRDILLATIVVVLVGVITQACQIAFRMFRVGFSGKRGDRGRGGGGLIIIVVGVALLILAPFLATLLRLAISRKREFLADASGTLLTRYSEGLISALEKLSQDPTPMIAAKEATAHLFIVNPFKGEETLSWFHKLFMTHPPIEERIKALRAMSV